MPKKDTYLTRPKVEELIKIEKEKAEKAKDLL
jgi:hypothetical protein